MTSLIIGLGYLGAALARALLARGEVVVGLESGFSTDLEALCHLGGPPAFRLLRGSAADGAAVAAAFGLARPQHVYLFAAQSSAQSDAAAAWYTEEVNLRAPRLVLDAAVRAGAGSVIYASSFHVYGELSKGVVSEQRPYGRFRDLSHLSKCHGEKLLEMYAGLHGFSAAALRFGICYGVGPIMKRDYRYMTVPNKFCLQAMRGEPLVVHGMGDRPLAFVHVADAVAATIAAADALGRAWHGYTPANVAGEVATVGAVAATVVAAAQARGLRPEVRFKPDAIAGESTRADAPRAIDRDGSSVGRQQRSFRVRSRLSALGYQPRRRLTDGVAETLDYFLGDSHAGKTPAQSPADRQAAR